MKPPSLTLDPFSVLFLSDPYAHHEALRETGAVVWLNTVGAYGIARHADVHAALRDHQTFLSGRGVGMADFSREQPWRAPSLLLETDPPVHDRTRSIMNRIVSLPALKKLREGWQTVADGVVEHLVQRRHFDAVSELGEAFPMAVFPDLIGVPHDGREALLPYAASVFDAFGPRNALFARSQAEAATAIGWIATACKRQSLVPGSWGAQVYDAADRGECSEEEAERLVRSFLSAGIDTTVNGISHLILALASHPEEYQKLRANPALIKSALDESLRWDGTVQTFFRTTSRTVNIGAYKVPEGAKVLLFLAAANRDPRRWTDPDRFIVNRGASGHVGFGFGIHQCLGQMVARLEAEVVLNAIVPRVAAICFAGSAQRRLNNTLHALASLPVEFVAA